MERCRLALRGRSFGFSSFFFRIMIFNINTLVKTQIRVPQILPRLYALKFSAAVSVLHCSRFSEFHLPVRCCELINTFRFAFAITVLLFFIVFIVQSPSMRRSRFNLLSAINISMSE